MARSLDQDARDALKRKVLKTGSQALTYQWFVDDPRCPDDVREYLLKMRDPQSLPMSLRRAAHVTPEAKARYRGAVAYEHIAFKCRHNDVVVDPATDEPRALLAGDIYISDDMSVNHPFWYELPAPEMETRARRGDKLAERHGVAVGRQGLYTIDARGKWLGAELIGRPRDAYTSADVLRHFRQVLAEFGMPRIGWVLEKGVWCANTVDGTPAAVVFDDAARDQIVAGLTSLGFMVEHVHTSEGKALIEGAFGHLQKIMDLLEAAPTIGRIRGEMEREKTLMRRVQTGVVHPADAGLPHIDDLIGWVNKAQVFFNGQRKAGRIQKGVPDERWHNDTMEYPLRKLEPQHMGVFMPLKHETEIRQGCVEKKLNGQLYRFSAPELFATLGCGYRVMVAFDPSDPAAGAELFNLEAGSRNLTNAAPGAWLGHAEWEQDRVLFGYTDEVAQSQARRKRFNGAFRDAYAGTGIFGKRAVRANEQRDGLGNVSRVESDSATVAALGRRDRTGPRVMEPEDLSAVLAQAGKPGDAVQENGLADRSHSRLPKIRNRFDLVEA